MKTQIFLIALIFSINASCANKSNFSKNEIVEISIFQISKLKQMNTSDSILNGIEKNILNAFVTAITTKQPDDLKKLERELTEVHDRTNNSIVTYWLAYNYFYHSLSLTISEQPDESEKMIDKGIELLEKVNKKNSEHYALLANMQSFSIQFHTGMKAPFISSKVKENANKSLELDSTNLRAYYVLGSNDFYTPEQFGGGKLTEKYLKKAITLNDQSIANPYLPRWGKNQAYELLIRRYIKMKNFDKAKYYYKEAISIYPDDYMINQLASQLIDK